MSVRTLIDTSAWIQALRKKGNPDVKTRVEQLLAEGDAAWCDVVRLELWRGVRGQAEEARLCFLEQTIPRFPINDQVWQASCELALKARRAGLQVPLPGLVVFACAERHGLAIGQVDRHYDMIRRLR